MSGSMTLVEVDNAPLQQIVEEGVILLLLSTSMVVVQIFVGHQHLVPQLVVETKMLEPLVMIMLKVELVDNLKGTRVRGAKRPLTPSLTSWDVGYASCLASTRGLFPCAQDILRATLPHAPSALSLVFGLLVSLATLPGR